MADADFAPHNPDYSQYMTIPTSSLCFPGLLSKYKLEIKASPQQENKNCFKDLQKGYSFYVHEALWVMR